MYWDRTSVISTRPEVWQPRATIRLTVPPSEPKVGCVPEWLSEPGLFSPHYIRLAKGLTAAASLLLAASLCDAAGKPLGSVILAEGARLDNTDAVVGSTVFSGDQMDTNQAGKIRLRLGAAQLYLLANSSITLGDSPEASAAILNSGTVGFATTGDRPVEVEIRKTTIRSKGPSPSNGEVRLINDKEFVVSSFHGVLEVNVDGDIHLVNEGAALRVLLDPDGDEAANSAVPGAQSGHVPIVKRRRAAFYLIPIGAAGIASYFVYDKLTESCSSPSTQ